MVRVWVFFLIFLGVPLAEGTRSPANEAELWIRSGIDSAFIYRFIRNDLCQKNERWIEACDRGLRRGFDFLSRPEAAATIRAEWVKQRANLVQDVEPFLKFLASAETTAPKAMVWGYMANKVLATFDPYARIQPDKYYDTIGPGPHKETGIGVQFEITEDSVLVRRVFKDTPAEEVGLRVNDRLLSVDGLRVQTGAVAFELLSRLRGTAGQSAAIEWGRGRAVHRARVIFRKIENPDAVMKLTSVAGSEFAMIAVYAFTPGVCALVQSHVQSAIAQKAVGVILDLRFNLGGWIAEGLCVGRIFAGNRDLAVHNVFRESFLPSELDLRPQTLEAIPSYELDMAPDVQELSIPVAVLVNAWTASISEVVTAALQDLGRAWVVGTGTMGKGTFQLNAASHFNPQLSLRHTVSEVLRINRTALHSLGVKPNFAIPFQAGESGRVWRMTTDKSFLPHPILPSREDRRVEVSGERQSSLRLCAATGLDRKRGDHQLAFALALLLCDSSSSTTN